MEALVQRFPGARLGVNAVTALVIWGLLTWVNQVIEPLLSYYLATAAMYATAMQNAQMAASTNWRRGHCRS